MNESKDEMFELLSALAALVHGDRWLCADGCAAYLGMFTPTGKVNRRGFLERIACRPEFPKPNPITRSWKKSEVENWAQESRRAARG